MENRRQHYRHEFAPTRPMSVRLESAHAKRAINGDLINLSIGGMCVYAAALQADDATAWTVVLELDKDSPALTIAAQRVNARNGDRAFCGFRFLEENNVEAADEREKAIWKFLLDEQRPRRV
jgi:c-di-GMP-binding flagellar brake protein YcgR